MPQRWDIQSVLNLQNSMSQLNKQHLQSTGLQRSIEILSEQRQSNQRSSKIKKRRKGERMKKDFSKQIYKSIMDRYGKFIIDPETTDITYFGKIMINKLQTLAQEKHLGQKNPEQIYRFLKSINYKGYNLQSIYKLINYRQGSQMKKRISFIMFGMLHYFLKNQYIKYVIYQPQIEYKKEYIKTINKLLSLNHSHLRQDQLIQPSINNVILQR